MARQRRPLIGMARLHRYARTGDYDGVAKCLAEGDDVNAIDVRNFSPLMLAARRGSTDIIRLLLKAGASTLTADPSGRTSLHLAAGGGHLDTVQALVAHGADVNAATNTGWTPVLEAAQSNSREVVSFLESHGANMSRRGREGMTAEEWLAEGGVYGKFQKSIRERISDPSNPNLAPVASESIEQRMRKLKAENGDPGEFAAKHGRNTFVWGYNRYRYAEPEVKAWVSRVAEILSTQGLLDQCEETYLQGDELEEARKCRAEREMWRAQISARNADRTVEASA